VCVPGVRWSEVGASGWLHSQGARVMGLRLLEASGSRPSAVASLSPGVSCVKDIIILYAGSW
jgi:hypothetical protein